MDRKAILFVIIFLVSSAIALSGCSELTAPVGPVEEQQIETAVKTYVTRDTNIPEYEAFIETVNEGWARVSIRPAGTSERSRLYLHKQTEGKPAPTVATTVQPGHTSRVKTTTGWVIVLGPQADFSEAELDEAGVPASVRL